MSDDHPFKGLGAGLTLFGLGVLGLALLVGLTWIGHGLADWVGTAF